MNAVTFYLVTVDYGLRFEEMVEEGKYDKISFDITSFNFPVKRKGKAKVVVELINFNRSIFARIALKKLAEIGYRSADLHELLALGIQYPDIQREFPIVELDSVWRNPYNDQNVVCLCGSVSERELDICFLGTPGDWVIDEISLPENQRFAAIRSNLLF